MADGGVADASDHVAQISERVDAVAFAAAHEAVEYRGGAAAAIAAEKKIIFAADRDGAQRVFGGVVVDRQIAVVGVATQRIPVRQCIVDRLADRALKYSPCAGRLLVMLRWIRSLG